MKRKILALVLAFLTFGLVACNGGDNSSTVSSSSEENSSVTSSEENSSVTSSEDSSSEETVSVEVPADTDVTLTIAKEDNNKTIFGIGTELDPHFFAQNVGLNGVGKYGAWSCEEEDWELFEQRMTDMNLKRIRVMLLPSWFVIDELNTEEGVYDWETDTMHSLYRVLDTAKDKGMSVNITMWGIDMGTASFMREEGSSEWVTIPSEDYQQMFVDCFADCIKYLIEEKEYDFIDEVTLFNEPNALYGYPNYINGVTEYCDLCLLMDEAFDAKDVRDDVLFNLSDDARDYGWLANVLMQLEGVIDIANSHTYDFGDEYVEGTGELKPMTNQQICYDNPVYNLNMWKEAVEGTGVPHMWGEFGTQNGVGSHKTLDKYTASRGLDVPRIALNFFNMGSVGMSYWVLFSQYYSRSDANSGYIMDMGLWGFADENYECRPVYYSYSMITRFIEAGDTIFPIESDDENIVAVAFRQGDKWSYAVVNNGTEAKNVAFVNMDAKPVSMARYVYDEANVPTNNQVIPTNGTVTASDRVLSDTVAPRTFVIYTSK